MLFLHHRQSQLQPPQYYSHPALTRYFDHIQSRPSVRKSAEKLSPAFSLVSIDFTNAPTIERKAPEPKKKDKAAKAAAAAPTEAAATGSTSKPEAVEAEQGKAPKKEKKEKEKKEGGAQPKAKDGEGKKKEKGGGKAAAPAEDAGEPVPSMIDLRVGHIVDGEFRLPLRPACIPL